MKRALIFQDDVTVKNTLDLLEVTQRMYGEESYTTYTVSINRPFNEFLGFFHHIIKVQDGAVELHDQAGITDILEKLHTTYQFDSILIPATPFGRMLAPRLAMRIHSGLVADVTDICKKRDRLEIIRPAFCGRILAGTTCKGPGPIMMSVRPNVFSHNRTEVLETEVIKYSSTEKKKSPIKWLGTREKAKAYDIRESEILISGGGGVGRKFSQLTALAEALNGQVSASRKLVDKSIAPRNIQVGQSGKTVSPKLYIALGIDGSMQHVEGLRNVETIISVNTNRNAPICSLSDIVIEGNALDFIDKMVKRINVYREENKQ
jgi:electron transfer flavoprotein alpha subunit